MLRFARNLRKDPTYPEYTLWGRLRRRQMAGARFRRQYSIGPYICDFACIEARFIVELDGAQHVEQSDYDAQRDAFLRSNGFRVVQFWNQDVVSRIDVVLETIYEALHRSDIDGRLE
jgi:very-short-patch-repair endonuclease